MTHAGNRGEHASVTPTRVCYVDDFHPVTQTVYEFHGCVWHGCPRYHPNCRLVPRVHLDRSMEEVYDATCAKTALLRSMGFTVVEMWECFWDDLSKHDPRLIQFPHTLEIVQPLVRVMHFTVEGLALHVCTTRPMKPKEKKYITSMSLLNIRG